MTAEREKFELELLNLDSFIESSAYSGWQSARDTEISQIEQRILSTPPITENDRSNVLMWFGELDAVKDMKKTFEDARVTLKAEIDKIVESENQNASDTKV